MGSEDNGGKNQWTGSGGRELCSVFYNNLNGKRVWKTIDTLLV